MIITEILTLAFYGPQHIDQPNVQIQYFLHYSVIFSYGNCISLQIYHYKITQKNRILGIKMLAPC